MYQQSVWIVISFFLINLYFSQGGGGFGGGFGSSGSAANAGASSQTFKWVF